MDLRNWLVSDASDIRRRLQGQVLDIVPAELRDARPGGGNSITWGLFHVTTHAELALATLNQSPVAGEGFLHEWGGLEESEPEWSTDLDPLEVEVRVVEVIDRIVDLLEQQSLDELDEPIRVADAFERAGVNPDHYAWLARMWTDQSNSFLVRWPLLGHVGNHIGELVAVRNRLGLSPF